MSIDIEDVAQVIRNAGKSAGNNFGILEGGVHNFIAPGYWVEFTCMRDTWKFDTFSEFCEEWLRMPEDKMLLMFSKDPAATAILNTARLNPDGTKSTREIAKETGQSKSTVHRQVSRHDGAARERVTYQISQYTTPATAAQKIRAKFGDEFARELAHALTE